LLIDDWFVFIGKGDLFNERFNWWSMSMIATLCDR